MPSSPCARRRLSSRPRRRRAPRRRQRARAVRHSARHQGHLRDQRRPHDLRVANSGDFRAAVRRDGDRTPARGRRNLRRQNQHGRIRDGLVDREFRVRRDDQSARHRARRRRLFGRLGGGGRGARMPRVARHRHRRLDSRACFVLRRGRNQADLQPRQPLRRHRVRVVARPGRPVHEIGARRRDTPAHSRRQGRARLDLFGASGSRLRARADRRRQGTSNRRAARIFRRGDAARGREVGARCAQELRIARRIDS